MAPDRGRRPNGTGDGLGRDALVASRPRSFGAESFRMVRANLEFVLGSKGHLALLVTSAGPSEGKSLVASNLAAALCEHGARVALVDADLRRGRVAKTFGVRQAPGLSNLLAGALGQEAPDFGAALGADGSPGVMTQVVWPEEARAAGMSRGSLWILPTGPYPPNSGQLVASPGMARLVETLKGLYDYVVIDTTPVLSVADAVMLSKFVDGVLLVVRLGIGNRDGVARAKAALTAAEANVLGTIINGVGSPGVGGYGYGYGYGYSYYYKGYYESRE